LIDEKKLAVQSKEKLSKLMRYVLEGTTQQKGMNE
jgi:hypothetical protein